MFKKRWLKREKIRAVHDNDLEKFLSSIGVLDQIVDGYYKCIFCDAKITIDNLGFMYPKGNKINFVCDRSSCLTKSKLNDEDAND